MLLQKTKSKAINTINSIKQEQKSQGNNWAEEKYNGYGITVYFENGIYLKAFPPQENLKGFRFHRLWCDKDINRDYLERIILPMACMKYEDIIWI